MSRSCATPARQRRSAGPRSRHRTKTSLPTNPTRRPSPEPVAARERPPAPVSVLAPEDLDLALRYLSSFAVLVVAQPLAPATLAVAVESAAYSGRAPHPHRRDRRPRPRRLEGPGRRRHRPRIPGRRSGRRLRRARRSVRGRARRRRRTGRGVPDRARSGGLGGGRSSQARPARRPWPCPPGCRARRRGPVSSDPTDRRGGAGRRQGERHDQLRAVVADVVDERLDGIGLEALHRVPARGGPAARRCPRATGRASGPRRSGAQDDRHPVVDRAP